VRCHFVCNGLRFDFQRRTIYTIPEQEAGPVRLNCNLAHHTNFMNLLHYGATAVQAGFQGNGLPFGVTLFAPRGQDGLLLQLAARIQYEVKRRQGRGSAPSSILPNCQAVKCRWPWTVLTSSVCRGTIN